MKRNVLTIMKKEFARFFGDKRLVFSSIILPGLMIYIMYSFMGSGMSDLFAPTEGKSVMYAVNVPASVESAFVGDDSPLEIIKTEPIKADSVRDLIKGEADIYVVFPENFDEHIANYVPGVSVPLELQIFYDSTDVNSTTAYDIINSVLSAVENSLANVYNINSGEMSYDVATEEDTTGMLFSMLLPFLLLTFIFTGCMAVAPESIAGEKERGTIAALLVTPARRSEIAIGKIIALSSIALLSGVSSFAGTMASLPKLMGPESESIGIDAGVYGAEDYAGLFIVIVSTVLLLVSLISIISALAKSVKEAGTLVMPLMLVVMGVGITSMLGGGATSSPALCVIPIYNSVACMNGIFSFEGSVLNIVITAISNIVYTAIAVFALKKMFDSEKVMFGK